jgi:hypothetical protein
MTTPAWGVDVCVAARRLLEFPKPNNNAGMPVSVAESGG